MKLFVVVKCTDVKVIDAEHYAEVWLTKTDIISIHRNFYDATFKVEKLESENYDVNVMYDMIIEELEV